jgi:hypothetical protein
MLQVINSRGRVLLAVHKAERVNGILFYSWRGDGFGGYGPLEHLNRAIATVKEYAPSARIVGETVETLPAP